MTDSVGALENLTAFESVNLYLEEGKNVSTERGEESTEAEGIAEVIIGTGMQVIHP